MPIVLLLLAGITGATPVLLAGEWTDPEIAGWAAELELDSLTNERRATIIAELAAASEGPLFEPRAAEAVFVLARFLKTDETVEAAAPGMLGRLVTLYPDDPRMVHVLRRLADIQLAAGESHAAHYTFTRLLRLPQGIRTAQRLIEAASNALQVGDHLSALDWTESLDRWELDRDRFGQAWTVRLIAAQALGRDNEALTALDRLLAKMEEAVSENPAAMLAAARTETKAGRLEKAEIRYRDFLNIHPRAAGRAKAMLEHARLLHRLQRPLAARRTLTWLTETFAGTPQADVAHVLLVDWQPRSLPKLRAMAYRDAAVKAGTEEAANLACERMLEYLMTEGLPLEAISVLTWMVRNTRGYPAVAARRSLMRAIDPALGLLESRDDAIGIAAVATAVASVALPIPPGRRATVIAAQRDLGLVDADPRLDRVQTLAGQGRWEEVNRLLAHADTRDADDVSAVRFAALAAEALWRLDQIDAALAKIETTFAERELDTVPARALIVLRADIAYAAGDSDAACRDYRSAADVFETPHVSGQLLGCEPVTARLESTEP